MKLSLSNIPENELNKFIQLMDGYLGIHSNDRSWIQEESSRQYKITLYCYLISKGFFYVEHQKLESTYDNYGEYIDYIEEFFAGKCIVNFTDSFFLNEINQAFCDGNWNNVHESWLVERWDYIEIIESRYSKYIVDHKAYFIRIYDFPACSEALYLIRRHKCHSTILALSSGIIGWKSRSYTSNQFIRDYCLNTEARITFEQITPKEFQSRFFDVVEPVVGSLLN